jgi:hypothetical protein
MAGGANERKEVVDAAATAGVSPGGGCRKPSRTQEWAKAWARSEVGSVTRPVVKPPDPARIPRIGYDDEGWWKAERLAVELGWWRTELEIRLAGAILYLPHIGLLRADECGVRAALFEREDAWCMYMAARYCAHLGRAQDRTAVLAMARAVLRMYGWWDDRAAAHERGMFWSERNLVNLALSGEGPGDVILYADQLIDLDRRVRLARRCWRRMTELLDGWGKVEIGKHEIRSSKSA